MTDPEYYCGSDARDSLTARPDAKAEMLPNCAWCGCVVYRIGRRVLVYEYWYTSSVDESHTQVLCVECDAVEELEQFWPRSPGGRNEKRSGTPQRPDEVRAVWMKGDHDD